jgi:hypothetical protein
MVTVFAAGLPQTSQINASASTRIPPLESVRHRTSEMTEWADRRNGFRTARSVVVKE